MIPFKFISTVLLSLLFLYPGGIVVIMKKTRLFTRKEYKNKSHSLNIKGYQETREQKAAENKISDYYIQLKKNKT